MATDRLWVDWSHVVSRKHSTSVTNISRPPRSIPLVNCDYVTSGERQIADISGVVVIQGCVRWTVNEQTQQHRHLQ